MDIKESDRRAKHLEMMPKGLVGYEQAYYVAARGLYEQYDKGIISLEQARIEKEQVVQMYKRGEEEWAYLMNLHQVEKELRQLKEEGFNTVVEFEILEKLAQLLK